MCRAMESQWEGQKHLQPLLLGLAIVGQIIPTLGSAQHRRNGDKKNPFNQMFPVSFDARIAQFSKILQRIVQCPL